jgi:hypothetical protein
MAKHSHYVFAREGRKDLEWDNDVFDDSFRTINLVLKDAEGEIIRNETYVIDRVEGDTTYWIPNGNSKD